ncbi:PIN domain-containing protein [Herbiconiux sp. CPCC 205716]|uniref:PIN domain-containing protein n=1 Tax=Herbiconiux gentiana TaxID=2970912 RepID=A0ABT2GDI8_9MICO|nr:PIN domain-containing protein [Herbiconiux gentiana]MCS5714258.1 PIN domain-containing protein [Herbiconiux gentiana]
MCALLDANVLYPSLLRDLLIRVSIEGGLRARWSEQILDETFRSLAANRPDLAVSRLDRTRQLMNIAVPDASVRGFEHIIEQVHLPDPDDRHVLAAAIHADAQIIVTNNLADFPAAQLEPFGIVAEHPDVTLSRCFDDDPARLRRVVGLIARATRSPPLDESGITDRMLSGGLPRTASRLRGDTRCG